MNNQKLIEKILSSTPPYEAENLLPFKKYGYAYYGIYDKWIWNEEKLQNATSEELLEMLNFSNEYWLKNYQKWYYEDKEKINKLDSFIGFCERQYFGYDDKYTLKTIDRIFNQIKDVLDKKYYNKKEIADE